MYSEDNQASFPTIASEFLLLFISSFSDKAGSILITPFISHFRSRHVTNSQSNLMNFSVWSSFQNLDETYLSKQQIQQAPTGTCSSGEAYSYEFTLLSDIDDQYGLGAHAPLIHFYHHEPSMAGKDSVKVIRQALAQTLVFYCPFAGRLRESVVGHKLVVKCNGEGIIFIEADTDVTLAQFGDTLQPPFPCFEDLLYNVPGFEGILHCPLLLIQFFQYTYLLGYTLDGYRAQNHMSTGPKQIK